MRKGLIALVVMFLSCASHAQYLTFGMGVMSCGEFLQARKDDSLDASLMSIWLGGYLTRFSRDDGVESLSTDMPSMLQWIQNYCEDNPLRNIAYAAARLTVYLEEHGLVVHLQEVSPPREPSE